MPGIPPGKKNPVFLYSRDHFQDPKPFRPNIAVNIDPAFEQKIDDLNAHILEVYEYGSQPDEAEIRALFPMLGTATPTMKAVKTTAPMNIDGHPDEAICQKSTRFPLKNSEKLRTTTIAKQSRWPCSGYVDF